MKRLFVCLFICFGVMWFSGTAFADLINITFTDDNIISPAYPLKVVLLNNRTGAPITGLTKSNFKLLRTCPKANNVSYSVTPITSAPGAYTITITGTFDCGPYGNGHTELLFYINSNPHYGSFEFSLWCID